MLRSRSGDKEASTVKIGTTHTFVILPVSANTYNEIYNKLALAGYEHAFITEDEGVVIDMHGIAISLEEVRYA